MPKKEEKKEEVLTDERIERVEEIMKRHQEIDLVIARMVNNAKQEFLRAFRNKPDKAKRDKINEWWFDVVSMWLRGQTTSAACIYAKISRDSFNNWMAQYDRWAEGRQNKTAYKPEDNPLRVLQESIKKLEEDKLLNEAERIAAQKAPGQLLDIRRYKNKERDPDVKERDRETKKKPKEVRRSRIEVDTKSLEIERADLRHIEKKFRPASMQSSQLLDQAREIRRQEKEYTESDEVEQSGSSSGS